MSAPLSVAVKRLPHAADLPLPSYATAGAAGLDLIAAIPVDAPVTLQPRARVLIPTGLIIALPDDHEAQVRPRSGFAVKQGVTVLNAPGTIDADYRGEIKVALVNLGDAPVVIERGMRIAQIVVAPITRIDWVELSEVSGTKRDSRGFGSTGMS